MLKLHLPWALARLLQIDTAAPPPWLEAHLAHGRQDHHRQQVRKGADDVSYLPHALSVAHRGATELVNHVGLSNVQRDRNVGRNRSETYGCVGCGDMGPTLAWKQRCACTPSCTMPYPLSATPPRTCCTFLPGGDSFWAAAGAAAAAAQTTPRATAGRAAAGMDLATTPWIVLALLTANVFGIAAPLPCALALALARLAGALNCILR